MGESSSSSSMHTERIVWPGQAHSAVICTGEFDNWQGTQLLSKNADGTWSADVKVPYDPAGEREIKYKFVVDGTWQHAESRPTVSDDSGNVNNVFRVPAHPPTQALAIKASAADADVNATSAEAGQAAAPSADERIEEIPRAQTEANGNSSLDLPATLQDLLGSGLDPSEASQIKIYNPSATLPSGVEGESGYSTNGTRGGLPGFHTISMSSIANASYLQHASKAYPSPYLLQTPEPTEQVTPTDVQVAAEYLIIRQSALREAVAASRSLQQQQQAQAQAQAEAEGQSQGEGSSSKDVGPASVAVAQPEPLGILKIFARMRERNPMWVVSEKRLRKVIKEAPAMAEAERITRLAGLTGLGKFGNDVVPVSRVDERLVADLEGRPYVPSSAAAAAAAARSSVNGSTDAQADDKENDIVAEASTSSTKKKSKKASKANGVVAEAAEKVKEAVAAVLPSSSAAAGSSGSGSGAGIADAPRGPTAIVGDVRVEWMGEFKGRGVVATKAVKQSKTIFKEDAFVFAPSRTIQQAINAGQGCGYCGKLFLGKATALVVSCTAHDAIPSTSGGGRRVLGPASGNKKSRVANSSSSAMKKSSSADKEKEKAVVPVNAEQQGDADGTAAAKTEEKKDEGCKLKFCSKLCKDRCHEQYANLLCTTVNPSYGALLRWMEAHDPRSSRQNPLGVFKLFLRLIVAAQRDGFPSSSVSGGQESSRDLLERTESLAAVNERTRRQRESQMLADMQWGEDWLTAFRLILEALQLPLKYYASSAAIPALRDGAAAGEEQESHQPKHPGDTLLPAPVGALPSWYTKDLPTELADKLLGFDNFLVWWGRVALNQEDDGGIFILHPCLNHSCDPNAQVLRTPHLNKSGAREAKPSRIYVVATRDIVEGEEITIAYQSRDPPLEFRREYLRKLYLFECLCPLCESQAAEREITLRAPESSAPAEPVATAIAPAAAVAEDAPAGSTAKKNKKKKSKSAAARVNGDAKPEKDAAAAEEIDEENLTLEQKAERMFSQKGTPASSTPWYEDVDE